MGNNPSQYYYGGYNSYDYTPGMYDNYDYLYRSGRGLLGNRIAYPYPYQYMPQPATPPYSSYDYSYNPWSSYYASAPIYTPSYSPFPMNHHYTRPASIYGLRY